MIMITDSPLLAFASLLSTAVFGRFFFIISCWCVVHPTHEYIAGIAKAFTFHFLLRHFVQDVASSLDYFALLLDVCIGKHEYFWILYFNKSSLIKPSLSSPALKV